jgi:cobalt-zinc-cadmium efflux system outer membrane protein
VSFHWRLVLSFYALGAFAEVISAAETVTLRRVKALAVRTHPAGLEAEALRSLGRAEISLARTWSDPEGELTFGEGEARDGAGASRSEFGWRVSQEIPFPLSYRHRVRAARFTALSLEAEAAARRVELLFSVELSYFDLAAATERLSLLNESAKDAATIFEISSRRVELGEARESERLRAEIELLRQHRALERAHADAGGLRAILRRLAGPDLPEDFGVEPQGPSAGTAQSLEALRRKLVDSNPELAAARAEARRAAESRRAAVWGVFPDLFAGGFEEREIDRKARGLSLGLSIPLWNANRSLIARSRAEESRAEAALRILEIELQNDLDKTFRDFQLASEQAEIYRARLLPAARESLRLARLAYEEGETSFLELLDSQRTFREAVTEWIDLRREAAASFAEVRRLTGGMLDDLQD